MPGTRKPSSLEEGLRNTEIKRETDVRNSLGPEQDPRRPKRQEEMHRDSDAYGRETPGREEDEQ